LVWLAAPLLSDSPVFVQGLRISAPMIVIVPFYSSFTAVFRAHQMMQPIAYLNMGMLIIQVTLTALIFATGGGIIAALVVNTVTSTGQLITAWWIYRRRFYHPAKQSIALMPLLRQGLPFAIAAVLAAFQMRLALILLEQFTDAAQVGLYAAAYRFIEAGRMLPHALFDALFPRLAELSKNQIGLQRTFFRVSIGLLVFAVCFAIGMLLFADFILRISYGEAFVSATLSLQILAVAFLPMLLRQGRILYAYALQYEQRVNVVIFVMLIIQGVLSLILIPSGGATGAAIVILVTEFIGMLLIWLIT
ncbi:MAG: oligosaccharide flippase family protein, partial [Aggregatilineales bacterium]